MPDSLSANKEKKIKESPKQAVTLFGTFQKVLQCNYIPTVISCQADLQDFIYFYTGGSPLNRVLNPLPISLP